MNNEKALDKIKKCLSLAQSSNPHEAANAWRQAQALMRRYNIEHADVLASAISAVQAKGGSGKTVPRWEMVLAVAICEAFECESIRQFYPFPKKHSSWVFIGEGSSPEIAAYAFEVIFRQVRQGRRAFSADRCQGLPAHIKRRQVDLYSQAWIYSLYDRVKSFARNGKNDAAIKAYIERHFNVADTMKSRGVAKIEKNNFAEMTAIAAGAKAAAETRLHHGMSGNDPVLLGTEV